MTVTIHKTFDEGLLKKWQKLWDESDEAHFHNAPQWFLASYKGFSIKNYLILTVENNGQLDAIFPLVWEKRFGIPVLSNPGERFTDKSTLLLRRKEKALIQAVLTKLTELGNLYLEEVPADIADLMVSVNPSFVRQQAAVNPYLELNPDPFRYVSKKNRSKMVNKIKKNEQDLHYSFALGDLDSLETAFEIDARSCKREKGTSDLCREREREFYRQLLRETGRNFRVDIVSYKGIPIIYSIGFLHKKTYHAGITAYDKDYPYLSPGKLLQYYLLRSLQEHKIELFDFSRGLNEFKKEFTPFFPVQYDMLYAKHKIFIYWWKIANFLYNFIYEHKTLYGTYLIFKRAFLTR